MRVNCLCGGRCGQGWLLSAPINGERAVVGDVGESSVGEASGSAPFPVSAPERAAFAGRTVATYPMGFWAGLRRSGSGGGMRGRRAVF